MMNNIAVTLFGAVVAFAASSSAMAASKKTVDVSKPAKITCEDFLTLDEVVKPKLVYWANGYNWWGSREDPYLDVEETDRLVPMVVQECVKAPTSTFVSKVKEVSKAKPSH